MKILKSYKNTGRIIAVLSLLAVPVSSQAAIQGLEGNAFTLYAKKAQISTPDGDSVQIWGFSSSANGVAQYPAPTLILDEGVTTPVEVTIYNVDVPQPVSLVFPGLGQVSKTCDIRPNGLCFGIGNDDRNVVEADGGTNSITYTFTPNNPGTYLYHSGVSPQIQLDMGLAGAMIVRPSMAPDDPNAAGLAYNNQDTAYDREFLFFHSEMDPRLHYLAENGALDQWDNADYLSNLFFFNGRNAPDTLAGNNAPELPHQPYGSLVKMYPGERILLRVLNTGRNQHPLHLHGNHFDQIARDGNLLMAGNQLTPITDYTLNSIPGSTADLIFGWTGRGMGWDIFNAETVHDCIDLANNRTGAATPDGFDDSSWEWCADHGKPLPVSIPENQDLAFGGFYGGSPYLGDMGSLPIGEGGLNPSGGMVFMWHSHSERELTNNDIFPGGMLTMMIVERRP